MKISNIEKYIIKTLAYLAYKNKIPFIKKISNNILFYILNKRVDKTIIINRQ